jgi:hypothetical protein
MAYENPHSSVYSHIICSLRTLQGFKGQLSAEKEKDGDLLELARFNLHRFS